MLGLLDEHTDTRSINILAYSAGAQILSPALDIIGRNTAKDNRKDSRFGEIYFAAPDIGVSTFVKHLQAYIDMPNNVALSFNRGDRILAFSARRNREPRIGRPNVDDLNPTEFQWLKKASIESALSIIEVSAETVAGMSSRSHNFWYSHPWVSSDILTKFVFQKGPRERGLVEMKRDNNARYWVFPSDYPQRIVDIVRQASEVKRKSEPRS